ncbi:MAG: lysophospholipid acyltransferase family protein [Luteolibacter sp.]
MAADPKHQIRGNRMSRFLGYVAWMAMKLWAFTLRYEVNGRKGLIAPEVGKDPVIFALWHNRIFTVPPIWRRTGGKNRSTVVLTSASKDGTTLATAMQLFGIGAVRGSSSRRAVSALIGMKKELKAGVDVCVTPDGPKGPRYDVQPGVIKIAQTCGVEIIPIHVRYSSAWRLKTWDRFVVPKPFSHVTVVFDTPRRIPKETTPEEFEREKIALRDCLVAGSDDA